MLVHRRVTPSIKFSGTHLYTWVERGTVRVDCLALEHNTARARTRTARSGVGLTNHEATVPPAWMYAHVDLFVITVHTCFINLPGHDNNISYIILFYIDTKETQVV